MSVKLNISGLNKFMICWDNLALTDRGSQSFADSEEIGFEASFLTFEDGADNWVSEDVTIPSTVSMKINLGSSQDTIAYFIGGSNIVVPYQLQWWNGDPDGGGSQIEFVDDIDAIVRENQLVIPTFAQALIKNNLLINPYFRSDSINHDWIQWVFDVSSGNGDNDFLKAAYVMIVKRIFSPRSGLSVPNAIDAETLSKFQRTSGIRASSIERFPSRSQDVSLGFLQDSPDGNESQIMRSEFLHTEARHRRVFLWRSADSLDLFHEDSLMAHAGETAQSIQLKGLVTSAIKSLKFEESR